MENMAITLKDIAKEAAINVGSVSHVLNNHSKAQELRQETRERILKIANKLGYHRNELARSIATGSSNVIAFISSDMGAIEYTGRIQKSVFQTASKLNYSVSFYQLTAGNQEEIIRKILEWKIAGIIFHTKVEERKLIMETAQKNNIQVGIINHTIDNLRCIGATSDDFQGAVSAVKHLADLGHSKITYVTVPGETEFLNNRYNGYLEGMKMFVPKQKPQIVNLENNDYDSWSSTEKFSELLNTPESKRPTAFFCAMDSLAMAFCRAAYIHGQRVPEDFSIVGFGDLEFAKYSVIPLTTIAQPFEEMSQVVTEKVINGIKNKKNEPENIKLNTELIIRQSTATLKKSKT
jgi:LacI family transcriptional regulator, galactose operon repressor